MNGVAMHMNLGIDSVPRSSASDESAMWLAARRLNSPGRKHWMVAIALDAVDPRAKQSTATADARLYIEIDSSEWGILFCCGGESSWIRVANVPRVHERDDFGLLPHITELRELGTFIQSLERQFHVRFRRPHATIHTNLVDAAQKILLWVFSAL